MTPSMWTSFQTKYFNMLSKHVVGGFAVTAGVLGLLEWGWLGAALSSVAEGIFGLWFVTTERMFR